MTPEDPLPRKARGGRPKGDPSAVRAATIGVRVSAEEYAALRARAEQMGMTPAQWLREAARLVGNYFRIEDPRRLEPAAREDDTPPHLRIKHAQRLSPRQLAILAALVEARDKMARTLNRPVHFIIRNDLMLSLAANPPGNQGGHLSLERGHQNGDHNSYARPQAVPFYGSWWVNCFCCGLGLMIRHCRNVWAAR